MRGLRTQEEEKFKKFFNTIQDKAREQNKVFFAESGEGHDFETYTMEGENLSGWLIPLDEADEFEQAFINRSIDDAKWDKFIAFAEWRWDNNKLIIDFK